METKTHYVNTKTLATAHDLALEALAMVVELGVVAPSNTSLKNNLQAAEEYLDQVGRYLVWARINNRIASEEH